MWTLYVTHKFLKEYWKLDVIVQNIIRRDVEDILRHADIIEILDDITIISEYDDVVVVPEHTVNYIVDKTEEKVYLLSVNRNGIRQKLTGYVD